MGLDCVITLPAGSGHGAPSKPITDAVSRFIRDSDYYYRAVYNHMKECTVCDPEEAILGYLENRLRRMFGRTSGGLVKLARRYRKKFPDRVRPEIPALFLERSLGSDWDGYMETVSKDKSVGLPELEKAIEFEEKAWEKEMIAALPKLRKMAQLFLKGRELPHISEAPQPFYNACMHFTHPSSRDMYRDESNAEVYDVARERIRKIAKRDYARSVDVHVGKAVKLIRIVRGDRERGYLFPLPASGERPALLSESGYLNDPDPEVAGLAQAIVVASVMRS